MSQIRPVSDLRNSFADISRTVHETREPVILTKNGYGDMVVMSYEEYQSIEHPQPCKMAVLWDANYGFWEYHKKVSALRHTITSQSPLPYPILYGNEQQRIFHISSFSQNILPHHER